MILIRSISYAVEHPSCDIKLQNYSMIIITIISTIVIFIMRFIYRKQLSGVNGASKREKMQKKKSKRSRYKNVFRYPVNEDDQSRIGRRGSRVEMILTNGRRVDTRRARFLPSTSIQPSGIHLKG